jgi:glutamine amidotransferase
MCIIAIQPKGIKIKENILRTCWDANNDGAGIMYVDNGKIIVQRELHDFSEFMRLKKHADKINGNIILHFRIATSGGINEKNLHPFKVNEHVYFCHNGILDIDVPANSPINDTQIFNNYFMKGLPTDFCNNSATMQLLEYSIGDRNKFVFLDSSGEFHILNEGAGMWDEGVWYSNLSYKKYDYKNVHEKSNYVPNKYWDDADDLCTCESCDEIVSIDEIEYDEYFDIMICRKCKDSILEYSLK